MKHIIALAAFAAAVSPAAVATMQDEQEQVYLPGDTEASQVLSPDKPIEHSHATIEMVSTPVVQEIPEEEEADSSESAEYRVSEREIGCLASAVHYEARGEPKEGQVAVVEVVLARKASGRFPGNACGVIAQKAQFSFVRGGNIPQVPEASRRRCLDIVMDVIEGKLKSAAQGATYFHAAQVRPSWTTRMRKVAQIGRHLFYARSTT